MAVDQSRLSATSRALPPAKPKRFRSLASRLVLVGLVQLVLLAVTGAVFALVQGPRGEAHPHEVIDAKVLAKLESLVDKPDELTAALEDLEDLRIEVSIYDANKQLVASNVDPPLAIPPRRRPPWRPGNDGPRHEHDGRARVNDGSNASGADAVPTNDSHVNDGSSAGVARTNDSADGSNGSGRAGARSSGQDRPRGPGDLDGRFERSGSAGPRSDADRGDSIDEGPPPMPPDGPGHGYEGDGRGPDGRGPDGREPDRGPDRRGPDRRGPDGRDGRGPDFGGPPPGGPPRAMVIGFRIHDERGYLVARGVHSKASFVSGPLLALIAGFVVMVLGALITARWIVRPIDRLSRTARALGGGELGARSRLDRADEIGELGHRIDEMADRIQTLLVTEKELLANVAHELRTPLTRIGVALDLASEGDSEAARASLAEIAVDVGELETIVDDILTAMRFEVASAREFPLKRELTTPAQIAEASEKRLRVRHDKRPFELHVGSDLPAIHVDRVLFRRVIDNLLENAHKYSPDPNAPLALDVSREGGRVVFEVRDRGIGILAEDLPRVFTAFFRGDRSRSRETGGVGLGLTLAKRIVEAHGGTIDIASKPGDGTIVRVSVPTADPS